MDPLSPSLELQKNALTIKRGAQFEVLISSGIMGKIMTQLGQSTTSRYGESLPVILGSKFNDTFCLFIGLEFIKPGEKWTKFLLIGSKTEGFIPNTSLGFDESDCEVVEGLYGDLQEFAEHNAPNYNLETGGFSDGDR